jgi:hypothetical protein
MPSRAVIANVEHGVRRLFQFHDAARQPETPLQFSGIGGDVLDRQQDREAMRGSIHRQQLPLELQPVGLRRAADR